MASEAAQRHQPWSLSKVKTALRCPMEFHFRYVERIPEFEVQPDARIGKAIHAALEGVLQRQAVRDALAQGRKELLSDEERERYDGFTTAVERFSERIAAFRVKRRVARELVEHPLAVRADFQPTDFYARDAFFRGVWDAGFVYDEDQLALVDHKTGIKGEASYYSDQLEGYALLAAAHMTGIRRVWLGVHFVSDGDMTWTAPIDLSAVRDEVAPRIRALIEEAAAAVAAPPEPRLSNYCGRCGYKPICPAHRGEPASREKPAPRMTDQMELLAVGSIPAPRALELLEDEDA